MGKITGICQDPSGIMWFCSQGTQGRQVGGSFYRYDGNSLTNFKEDNNNPNSLGFNALETIYADKQGMIWIGGYSLDRYNPATRIFTHFKDLKEISCILKDHKGNIWVGTFNGLNLLNEKTGKFIHFQNDSSNPKSLSDNYINALYEDKQGQIWIGTGFPWNPKSKKGGLNRANPDGSFTRFLNDPQNANSLLNNQVRALFEDSRGNFWVGTSHEGLHLMDRGKGSFTRLLFQPDHPDTLSAPPMNAFNPTDGITFITEDKSGSIWIGSYQQGLSRYDPRGKKMTRYREGNGFPDSSTFRGFISNDGTLWVASENSSLLYRADPTAKIVNHVSMGSHIWETFLDRNGRIWASTEGEGLFEFDENKKLIRQFKHKKSDPNSVPNDSIYALFQFPGEDAIWIGTPRGIVIFDPVSEKFSVLHGTGRNGALLNCVVIGFCAGLNHNLWIKTFGSGLLLYNREDGSVKQWLPDPKDSASLGSHNIASLLVDRDQNLWVGTWDEKAGVYRLDGPNRKIQILAGRIILSRSLSGPCR